MMKNGTNKKPGMHSHAFLLMKLWPCQTLVVVYFGECEDTRPCWFEQLQNAKSEQMQATPTYV